MSMDSQADFRPKGLIFGLLVPGAGHIANGEVARGLLIAAGVLGLFFGGILIGGIDVIDSQEDRVWFIGEALIGPIAFGIDQLHQNHFKAYDGAQLAGISTTDELARLQRRSAYPNEVRKVVTINILDSSAPQRPGPTVPRSVPVFEGVAPGQGNPPNKKSLSKVNELGTLFSTIAGMLNLIAVIDAAFPTTRRKQGASASATAAAPSPVSTPAGARA
jgi:hypothetical protein